MKFMKQLLESNEATTIMIIIALLVFVIGIVVMRKMRKLAQEIRNHTTVTFIDDDGQEKTIPFNEWKKQ